MKTVRRHQGFAAWLALVAMLALALLPTVSQALAPPGSGFAEVCTPQGMKVVALADGEQRPPASTTHLAHCALCCAAVAGLVMPPAPPAPPLPKLAGGTLPPPSLPAPTPRHAWAAPQPRGPPAPS